MFEVGVELNFFIYIVINDCSDAPQTSGVYIILNHGLEAFPVYCDQTNDDGGML